MRFLADMGISPRIVQWLRDTGHDAVHLRERRLYRLPDRDVFAKAADERRILLTFDLDFGEILALSGARTVSVVLFRLHNTRTPHVLDRLSTVLERSSQALDDGAIVVVQEGRHRIRRLPLRG